MMFLLMVAEGVDVAVFIRRSDGDFTLGKVFIYRQFHSGSPHLPGEFDHLFVVAVALHAELLCNPADLLRYLLLHEVHAHGDEGHPCTGSHTVVTVRDQVPTKDTVDDSEAHLHEGHGVVLESLKRLAGGVVSKPASQSQTVLECDHSPDGGESDEAEVGRLHGRPTLPVGEQESSSEDEGEDEDEVDHDGDHDQVSGHVPLLPNLVKGQTFGPPVNARRQL